MAYNNTFTITKLKTFCMLKDWLKYKTPKMFQRIVRKLRLKKEKIAIDVNLYMMFCFIMQRYDLFIEDQDIFLIHPIWFVVSNSNKSSSLNCSQLIFLFEILNIDGIFVALLKAST